jgi:hypothetical protein
MSRTIVAPKGQPAQPASHILAAPPRHIAREHWAELVEQSGISPALAAANFRSFGANEAERERQALLAERFAQLNPQPGHSFQARLRLQQAYAHIDGGGWRFLGDALPGHQPTPRWKPNQPRIDSRGRRVKYEAQPGRRPGLLLPVVPITVWRLVAERHGLALPADRSAGFWAWALSTPALPLALVEGEKKACALLGLGLVAVGLGGVELGRVVERSGRTVISEALAPELQALAPGRSITVCFDADPRPDTAQRVERAAVRLGHALARAGADVRLARLPLLEGGKCGPDDLLVAQGPEALERTLADAQALAEVAWERRYWAERKTRATRSGLRAGSGPGSLVEALQQATAPVVGIRAPKGAGKTAALEVVLAERAQVLAITHRRSLGAAMASRLGLVWRNDTDSAQGRTFDAEGNCWEGLPPRYALCIDSLLAVRPEAYAGGVVVLDEAEQLLAHLLTSSTCRHQRGLLIQRFQQVVRLAGQVVALDADLSDTTLAWLQQARGEGPADVALLVGDGPRQAWPVYWYEQGRADEIQAALLQAAERAPVFITTDSKERAAALHALLQHHLPEAQGLLISSETTGKAETQAWLAKLTSIEALAAGAIRWVVASPSIGSGLSIEHGYFRTVWGVFGAGSITDADALQALARIRQPVPRHAWCAPVVRPAVPPLTSAWWPQQVLADLRKRWAGQQAILAAQQRQELLPDLLLAPEAAEALEQAEQAAALWADLQSRRNYALAGGHLRAFIKARLRAEGHHIIPTAAELEAAERAELQAIRADLRSDRQQAHAQAVAAAPVIGKAEADRLRRLEQYSPALQRRTLVERLGLAPDTAITPEQVIWAERWAGAAERLACLLEPELAARLDLQRLQATTPEGMAPLAWDQSFRAQRSRAADLLGLRAFIDRFCFRSRLWDRNTPEVLELAQRARDHRQQVELALGVRIKARDTDTALVGALLLSFGITTSSKRTGSTCRMYGAEADQLSLVRACADRLRRKGSGQAPPSADKGASLKKTAAGGAPQQQAPARPWPAPAQCEQLSLATATDAQGSAQRAGGCSASKAPAQSCRSSAHVPWGAGGPGHRGPAIGN